LKAIKVIGMGELFRLLCLLHLLEYWGINFTIKYNQHIPHQKIDLCDSLCRKCWQPV
jgi:hypothetical protein